MRKFYFDCFDGEDLLVDVHGIELDGIHEVADQAIELAAKLLADNLCQVRARTVFVSARGEDGPPIYCAHGGFVGQYTDHGVAQDNKLNSRPLPSAP